jgi:hypothetical protein
MPAETAAPLPQIIVNASPIKCLHYPGSTIVPAVCNRSYMRRKAHAQQSAPSRSNRQSMSDCNHNICVISLHKFLQHFATDIHQLAARITKVKRQEATQCSFVKVVRMNVC